MRRMLPRVLVAAVLLRAAPALADPLDLDLHRLGNPSDPDARQRFALLSSEMALALSSFILHPPSTTGLAGLAVDLETGWAPVHPTFIGGQTSWPTRGPAPGALWMPSLHVRKGLPFSFEIGGRIIYLYESTMVAAQGELKWALNEGLRSWPDLALRVAVTRLFGQPDWNLSTLELDLMLGKRFAVGGVSLTPYGAFRLTWMDASTGLMSFPAGVTAFPPLLMHDHLFVRWTLGVRLIAAAASVAAEATYFGGKTVEGPDYPTYEVPSSLAFAWKVGVEL